MATVELDTRAATEHLRERIARACRHLLSQQDRDPTSPTRGCFDRRFWAWKLVDFPEATFQRNVAALAWLARQRRDGVDAREADHLVHAVRLGLNYALAIQHPNGSFDQAFPHEYSFGATAFVLHSLLDAYTAIRDESPAAERAALERGLRRAADFLVAHDETHGHIANHLAGAALALAEAERLFGNADYGRQAESLVARILDRLSPEGWFQEYEGADPGYQTLCVSFLAAYQQLRPSAALSAALERAVAFLAWFIHPDGSFGGEYGSRRTAIFYLGGIARLSRDNPLARRMTATMLRSIVEHRTVTLDDVDFANYAPMLTNYIAAVEADLGAAESDVPLPWEAAASRDFPQAGLFVRATAGYYAVFGASNGGVLKVFDRATGRLLRNDAGYVGQVERGPRITTQITRTEPVCVRDGDSLQVTAPFFELRQSAPSPLLFVVLRVLNLTLMRSLRLGNCIKAMMVRVLITGKRRVPLELVRQVTFLPDRVVVRDRLHWLKPLRLRWLSFGIPFVSIHMASARYFHGYDAATNGSAATVDLHRARAGDTIHTEVVP